MTNFCLFRISWSNLDFMTGFSGHGFKFGALMGRLAAGVLTEKVDPEAIRLLAAGLIDDELEIERLTRTCLA